LNGKVTATSRLTGTANMEFSVFVNQIDSEVVYDVFGFRQG
jgi:hypothetical protein